MEAIKMKKQYYKCLKLLDGQWIIDYWYVAYPSNIMKAYDYIIPIGTRKPYKIPKESIKE